MKRLLVAILLFIAPLFVHAGTSDDMQAIKDVMNSAYIQAVHAQFDADAMRAGFHKGFVMFLQRNGELMHITRDEWIEMIEGRVAKNGSAEPRDVSGAYPHIDIEGNAASIRVDVTIEGKHVYTDYFLLYKFDDGWKIVGKSFHSH